MIFLPVLQRWELERQQSQKMLVGSVMVQVSRYCIGVCDRVEVCESCIIMVICSAVRHPGPLRFRLAHGIWSGLCRSFLSFTLKGSFRREEVWIDMLVVIKRASGVFQDRSLWCPDPGAQNGETSFRRVGDQFFATCFRPSLATLHHI